MRGETELIAHRREEDEKMRGDSFRQVKANESKGGYQYLSELVCTIFRVSCFVPTNVETKATPLNEKV